MTDRRQRIIWLGTCGLGGHLGGIAQVARSCVAALRTAPNGLRLQRIISLLDREAVGGGPGAGGELPRLNACRGSRFRFAAQMMAQVVWRPELIVYDHVDLAQCQTLLPRNLRSPHVIWVCGVEVWRQLSARKQKALRTADLLLYITDYTRRRFEEHHGDGFRGSIVPLTADLMNREPAPARQRRPWIVTVGRLEPGRPKGHHEILAALPEVARVVPDVQWHVVGAGSGLADLRELVAASPCRDCIHVHGFLSAAELQKLFDQSRVFCMPSYGEGFGIVYLEAMSHGCVPIGSTLDAAPEVIGDGGFCVDPRTRTELPAMLLRLLTASPEELQTLSDRAFARSRQFLPSLFQERFLSTLQALPALQTRN